MNDIINNIKYKIFISLFIIHLSILVIKCNLCSNDCSVCPTTHQTEGSCEPCCNCRKHIKDDGSGTCYHCEGNNKFISIINDECQYQPTCENKVIHETMECVKKCPKDYWELGDYCYSALNVATMTGDLIDPFKIAKCKYKYEIIKEDNQPTLYNCLGENEKCESEYYNGDTMQCVSNCESTDYTKVEGDVGDPGERQYRCTSKCKSGEYEKDKNCFYTNDCYYYLNLDGVKICTECKEESIYNIYSVDDGKNTCVKECTSPKKIIYNENEKHKQCVDLTSTSENYYLYNGIYFKNCSYPRELFNNIVTYKYEKETDLKCVEDCSLTSKPFLEDGECKDKCTNFYYGYQCLENCGTSTANEYKLNFAVIDNNRDITTNTISSPTDESNIIDIDLRKYHKYECLNKCPIGTYINEESKECYVTSCPEGKYIDSNSKCIRRCEGFIAKKNFILKITDEEETGTGGRRLDESILYYNIAKYFCLSDCPTASPYLNKNENTCYDTDCATRDKYSAFNNPFLCYNSCLEIGNEFNYESNHICYNKKLICDKPYYYLEEGTNLEKCADYNECKEKGFKYIIDKQCVKECDSSKFYSYKDEDNLGECFSSSDNCIKKGYKFFNDTEKICEKTCKFYKTSETDPIKNNKNETCFKSFEDCPEGYINHDENKKICYKVCPNFIYKKENKCLDDCRSAGYYNLDGSNECLDNCVDGQTYYESKISNYTCYTECPQETPFIEKREFGDTSSYKCVSECLEQNGKSQYYYEDTKKCQTAPCDIFKSINDTEKICVRSCKKGQKLYKNKFCVDDCSDYDDFPLTALEKFSSTDNTPVDKCVLTCPSEYPLIVNSTKRCVKECPLLESFKYKGYCYEKCPNNTFYDALNNNCSDYEIKCPPGLKYYEKNGDYYECKMSCPKNKFHPENGGECLERCEPEQYIGGNNFCLSKCDENTGEYFIMIDNEYNISQCVPTCGNNYTIYDTKECVSQCPADYYKSESNKTCYKECNLDNDFPFSTKKDGILICDKKCNEEEPNFGTDLICRNGCSGTYPNITDYDGACVDKCENPLYKYLENWTCVKECSTNYTIEKDLKCVDECLAPNNFIVGKECRSKCDDNHFIQEDTENGKTIYKCLDKCDEGKYYYEKPTNKRKCLDECQTHYNTKDYIIENTNICIASCNSSYYSYHPKENFNSTYKNNTCVKQCPQDMPFYDTNKNCLQTCRKYVMLNEYNCLDDSILSCPRGTKEVDNYICGRKCPDYRFNNGDECVDNCPPDKYYIPGINNCLDDCDRNLYRIDGVKCVISCNETSFYINKTNTCWDSCPEQSRYYIEYYTFDNGFTSNSCFEDCPLEYPFYSDNDTIQAGITLHVCKRDCQYAKKEENFSVLKCLDDTDHCPNDNPCYDPETKICNQTCPDNKKYYITLNKNNTDKTYYECYDQCPNNYYINQTDEIDNKGIECVDKCGEGKFLDYGTKICVNNCDGKKEFEDDDNTKFCLDNCTVLGLFTNGNQCVKKCNTESHLVENMMTKTCDCENLFYKNGIENICLDSSSITKCSEISTDTTYYRKYKGYECVTECDGFLSVNEDYCYPEGTNCPDNQKENNDVTHKKCECSYNYYKDNNLIICLGENVECPSVYPLLINKTKECVQNCGTTDNYTIEYDGKCLNQSDDFEGSFTFTDNKPNCGQIMYFNGEKYVCSSESIHCGNDQYLIKDLNKCVNECENPEYFIYDTLNGKKECVASCNSTYSSLKSELIEDSKYKYSCTCKYKWYQDAEGKKYCAENNWVTCGELTGELGYNYLIKSTNECISQNCSEKNLYNFNNECYESCEEAKMKLGYNIINDTTEYKCKCDNLWKGEENNKTCINDLICIEEGYQFEIKDTKQCTNECPSETFELNNICYSSCPSPNTFPNNSNCECNFYYFEYMDETYNSNFKKCLSENEECPIEYPYIIPYGVNRGKCIDECPSGSKKFNYKCYNSDNIPENTKQKNENELECDGTTTWRRYIKNNREYFDCNVQNCTKKDNTTNECVNVCKENQYIYKNNCFESCPSNTRTPDDISKDCVEIIPFNESESLDNLHNDIKQKIGTLYQTSSNEGIIFNLNNSTLQIYGLNKNRKEKTEFIIRSNLTYIDLSNCINKIYEENSNNLNSEDDIVIVKYDIGDKTDSLTINPVEFQAFNSRTGEEISLAPCRNAIVISYPISSILNTYDLDSNKLRNLDEDINNLNLKEKFLKGKALYIEDKEIDSFNFQNKLYTDVCCPCEINGKDLILEDRFKYLYPLSFTFCESNCIYGHTDFIEERIFCNCSPKDGLNFGREFSPQINNANDKKAKDNQKGSILKCFTKVSNISKNFGFFYGLIIILVEIGMLILTILYSYKVFKMRVKKKFDITENEIIDTENIEEINLRGEKNRKTDQNIKTSERNLENPPKKNNNQITKVNTTDKRKDRKKETKKTARQDLKDPEVININNRLRIKGKNSVENEEKMSYNSSSDNYYEKSSIHTMKELEEETLFELIKNEEKLLTVDYNSALRKNKAEILVIILTEILDKIYLIKVIWFLQKYEIFSLYFSLYLLWHMLIVSFLSLFYTNNTLHKIWIKDNYPDLNYYLGFGFVACIISFVFYKGLSFLINNDKKIKEIENLNKENKREIGEKYNKMMFWAKIKMIIFYIAEFILLIIFFFYLIAFCGVNTGTSSILVEGYGIALIEVIIIKVLYGLVLGILRKISLSYEINILYTIVRFLDLYIS